jgi:hypothetical protein
MYFGLASVISSIVGDQANGVELPYLYTNYDNWVEGTFNNGGLELFNAALDGSGYTCLDMLYNGMSARDIIAKCRKHLEPTGVYPLPRAAYSMKYRIFRLLANSKYGMGALRLPIPSQKPAKQ